MPIPYTLFPLNTDDGWELSLFRCPTKRTRSLGPPILLLPGANSNRFTFGLFPEAALTTYLRSAGRDVWILEFRGSASSRWTGHGAAYISIDDKLRYDLPTAVACVRDETGQAQVQLIGHSLGGLMAYLYMAGEGMALVERAVTLCAPASFENFWGAPTAALGRMARWLAPLADGIPRLGIPELARIPGPLGHLAALGRHLRPETTERRLRRAFLDHAIEDIAGGELSQLIHCMGRSDFVGRGGAPIHAQLEAVRAPVLAIAAAGDRLIRPASVRQAYTRLGSRDKALYVVGRETGHATDFAHADLLISAMGIRAIGPHILRWLETDFHQASSSELPSRNVN